MGTTISGLFSNIDTTSLINSIIQADSINLNNMQSQVTADQNKESAIDAINTSLTQFQTLVDELRGASNLAQVSAQSSNTNDLTVTTSTGATQGTHSVLVHQLATSDRIVQAGMASETGLVGAGQFVYTYNGVTRTIQTTATTTLDGLRDLINNDSSNPGVTASVLDYTADADHEFHLVLAGTSPGANYAINVESGTTLANFGAGASNWTETQTAQNSQIQVDGYPSTGYIERSSNTISDVIPGVTMTLQQADDTPVSLTLTQDTSQLTTALQYLVSTYNAINSTINTYTGYDSSTKAGGLLQGDGVINDIAAQIRAPLVSTLAGFTDGQQPFTMASELGLSVDKSGTLSLDTTVLNTALSTNYQGVLNLIGGQGLGDSDNTNVQFIAAGPTTVAGQYDVQVDFDASGNAIGARIRTKGETTWREATIDGGNISGQNGNPEAGLSFSAAWDGSSTTESATLSVRQGIAQTLYSTLDSIVNAYTGPLAEQKQSYEDNVTVLNDQIAQEQERLATEKDRLTTEYAQMEQTLAQMDEMRTALASLAGGTTNVVGGGSNNNSNNSTANFSASTYTTGTGTTGTTPTQTENAAITNSSTAYNASTGGTTSTTV